MDSSYGHQGSCYGSSVASLKVFELFDVPFQCDEIWKGRKTKSLTIRTRVDRI